MIENIYFFFLIVVSLGFSMSVISTKRIAAKERKIREELRRVQNIDFESHPQ